MCLLRTCIGDNGGQSCRCYEYVKDGIRAARLVMEHTKHTLLVGEQASAFALSMGLPGPTNLSSSESIAKWSKWKENSCQPNFWKNVVPANDCGPYNPRDSLDLIEGTCSKDVETVEPRSSLVGLHSHDTIAMAAIDKVSWCTIRVPFIIFIAFN